ncbi:MAG: sigma-54 dependent transcriptional regulator [Vicinamibacteria bacterium]
MARRLLLLVDDDPSSRFALREYFELRGFEVAEADSLRAALASFQASRPDAAILDHSLPDGTALDLLPRLRALDPSVPLIVLTGHGSIDLAVQAVKEGAEHFFTKPVELATLAVVIERLLDRQRQRQRALAGRSRDARRAVDPFLGTSHAIRRLADEAARVRESDSPVLIQGETGTGKGVLAAWLHQQGPRAEEAFVDLNCATLSKELLESELFGHEKGAFTGAVAAKQGLLEVAHRGTLFLDEVGDMDPLVQPKLLKVLEEQRYRRVGEVRDRQVDVRLIAATHQDLAEAVREKRFRGDLFYRISTIPLAVPALRERPEDLPLVARELLDRIAGDLGRARMEIAPQALRALQDYAWPGNVRELRNVLERAALLCRDRTIDAGDLRFLGGATETPAAATASAPPDTSLTLEEVEQRHIAAVLAEEGGRVEAAARRLGVPRSSLYKRLRALGLTGPKP